MNAHRDAFIKVCVAICLAPSGITEGTNLMHSSFHCLSSCRRPTVPAPPMSRHYERNNTIRFAGGSHGCRRTFS